MNLNRRVPNGLPGGVRGRKFYYFLLLDYKKSQQIADLVIDSMMEYGGIITDRFKYITTTFIVFNDGWQSFNCRSFRT